LLYDCGLMLEFCQGEVLADMVAEEFNRVFANFDPIRISSAFYQLNVTDKSGVLEKDISDFF